MRERVNRSCRGFDIKEPDKLACFEGVASHGVVRKRYALLLFGRCQGQFAVSKSWPPWQAIGLYAGLGEPILPAVIDFVMQQCRKEQVSWCLQAFPLYELGIGDRIAA